jgi:hypothetical protein
MWQLRHVTTFFLSFSKAKFSFSNIGKYSNCSCTYVHIWSNVVTAHSFLYPAKYCLFFVQKFSPADRQHLPQPDAGRDQQREPPAEPAEAQPENRHLTSWRQRLREQQVTIPRIFFFVDCRVGGMARPVKWAPTQSLRVGRNVCFVLYVLVL